MNRLASLFLCCALIYFFGSCAAAHAAVEGPSIAAPERNFDFGESLETVPVSHDFTIKNEGTSPLYINDVRPG